MRPAGLQRYTELQRVSGASCASSVIYEAYDAVAGRRVVLKQVAQECEGEISVAAARETLALQRMHSQNIVHLYGSFVCQGAAWIVLERCVTDLAAFSAGHVLSPAQRINMMRMVLSALSHVHRAGYVHRDVSLKNILLCENGRAKLADFGLTRKASPFGVDTGNIGTPSYKAPEIMLGARKSGTGGDLWAVGLCWCELIMQVDGVKDTFYDGCLRAWRALEPEAERENGRTGGPDLKSDGPQVDDASDFLFEPNSSWNFHNKRASAGRRAGFQRSASKTGSSPVDLVLGCCDPASFQPPINVERQKDYVLTDAFMLSCLKALLPPPKSVGDLAGLPGNSAVRYTFLDLFPPPEQRCFRDAQEPLPNAEKSSRPSTVESAGTPPVKDENSPSRADPPSQDPRPASGTLGAVGALGASAVSTASAAPDMTLSANTSAGSTGKAPAVRSGLELLLLMSGASEQEASAIALMMQWSPNERISAADALLLPCFAESGVCDTSFPLCIFEEREEPLSCFDSSQSAPAPSRSSVAECVGARSCVLEGKDGVPRRSVEVSGRFPPNLCSTCPVLPSREPCGRGRGAALPPRRRIVPVSDFDKDDRAVPTKRLAGDMPSLAVSCLYSAADSRTSPSQSYASAPKDATLGQRSAQLADSRAIQQGPGFSSVRGHRMDTLTFHTGLEPHEPSNCSASSEFQYCRCGTSEDGAEEADIAETMEARTDTPPLLTKVLSPSQEGAGAQPCVREGFRAAVSPIVEQSASTGSPVGKAAAQSPHNMVRAGALWGESSPRGSQGPRDILAGPAPSLAPPFSVTARTLAQTVIHQGSSAASSASFNEVESGASDPPRNRGGILRAEGSAGVGRAALSASPSVRDSQLGPRAGSFSCTGESFDPDEVLPFDMQGSQVESMSPVNVFSATLDPSPPRPRESEAGAEASRPDPRPSFRSVIPSSMPLVVPAALPLILPPGLPFGPPPDVPPGPPSNLAAGAGTAPAPPGVPIDELLSRLRE